MLKILIPTFFAAFGLKTEKQAIRSVPCVVLHESGDVEYKPSDLVGLPSVVGPEERLESSPTPLPRVVELPRELPACKLLFVLFSQHHKALFFVRPV